MRESWPTRFLRWRINWFPAFRRTGARVVYLSEDRQEMRIKLPLNRATRNLNGTIYGGAIYSAVDPLHALLVHAQLGEGYQIWTKAARISFRRQGRSTLHATARVEASDVAAMRAALATEGRAEKDFRVDLLDAAGEICAHCVVTVHARLPNPASTPIVRLSHDLNATVR